MFGKTNPQDEKVLMIRLDNIGDFVVWLDAAKQIAQHYQAQGKRVTLLANAVWHRLAAELGVFDEVIGLEEKRFRRDLGYRLQRARELRRAGFGTAVQPTYTRLLGAGDALLRLSGATVRVGPEGTFERGSESDRAIGDRWYTALYPSDPAIEGEMLRNAAFVRALTGTDYKAKVADLREHLPMELPNELHAALDGRPYFVLFPGASFAGRLWPAERYAQLAERLTERTGWLPVLCGGPSEAPQAALISGRMDRPVLNWVGRTSLAQLAAVLANARLLVGNETSAVHIAAAVGTPTVCLLGGGHYGRFMPYAVEERDGRPLPVAALEHMSCFHCDWRCVHHPPKGAPVPCIEKIDLEAAWTAVQAALGPRLLYQESGTRSHSWMAAELNVLQCS